MRVEVNRSKITERLATYSTSLSELYTAATLMFEDKLFPGRFALICHAVREIRNSLPQVISGKRANRFDATTLIRAVSRAWQQQRPHMQSQEASEEHLSSALKTSIENLLHEFDRSSRNKADSARHLYNAISPSLNKVAETMAPIIKHYTDSTEWFVRWAHDPRQTSKSDEAELEKNFRQFEQQLNALLNGFFAATEILDEILKDQSVDLFDQAVASMSEIEHQRYFFSKLTNPDWLTLLDRHGFFNHAPEPIQDEATGRISHTQWPLSEYLKRMTANEPEKVTALVKKLAETNNIFVMNDLMDAVSQLRLSDAVKLGKEVMLWCDKGYRDPLLVSKIAQFASKLAVSGNAEKSHRILTQLLSLEKTSSETEQSDLHSFYRSEPKPRVGAYEFEHVITIEIKEIHEHNPLMVLALLCDLLHNALRASGELNQSEDFSSIWRRSIPKTEDDADDDGRGFGFRSLLVTLIRNQIEELLQKNRGEIDNVIEILDAHKTKIFQRLKMYLLARFLDIEHPHLAALILNEKSFENLDAEYAQLLKTKFSNMENKAKKIILSWITKGPNVADYNRWMTESNRQPTKEQIKHYVKRWKLSRYALVSNDLPTIHKRRYLDLLNEIGAPVSTPQMVSYWATEEERELPILANKLAGWSTKKLLDYLKQLTASDGFAGLSMSDFDNVLSSMAENKASTFLSYRDDLLDLHPAFVRSIIKGLAKRLTHKPDLLWSRALTFFEAVCRVVVDKETMNQMRIGSLTWFECHQQIIYVMRDAFQDKTIPYVLQKKAWNVVAALSYNESPSLNFDSAYDPFLQSVNSIRPEAFRIVIMYLFWLRQNPSCSQNAFSANPIYKPAFERLGQLLIDTSPAVRSMVGQQFVNIFLLDRDWTNARVNQIFPTQLKERELFEAAWIGYIRVSRFYTDVFVMLQSVYGAAVRLLLEEPLKHTEKLRPEKNLAEHLMHAYGIGSIDLENPILTDFWKYAPDEVRYHAMYFIGEAVGNTRSALPPELVSRFKKLWSERAIDNHTLRTFGRWFASKQFGSDWSLEQLSIVLAKNVGLSDKRSVVKALIDLVQHKPAAVAICVKGLVCLPMEYWDLYSLNDDLKTILTSLLNTEQPEVVSNATEIVNILGSKGFHTFGELLR